MGDSLQAAEIAGHPSYDDVRMFIQRALTDGVELHGPDAPWVVECTSRDAIVNRGRKHYRYPYTVNAAGDAVELGTPVEVRLSWRDTNGELVARDIEAGTLAFATDLRGLQFSEDSETVRIEVCRDGKWKHARYGDIEVTPALRESFIANFQANTREVGDLPLDYDHEAGPAPGWITGLVNEGNSLFADVKLTPSGRQKIRDGEYRFFSPEWHPDWENPRTGQKHGPTLFGGALTNKPFFRGMAAIQCSETTGATPQEKDEMPETQRGTEGQGLTTQQYAELQQRLVAVEAENAALRAAEERRNLDGTLSSLTFSEGRTKLAPASRGTLVDALMNVPSDKRQAIVDAVKSLQFAEFGERGFVPVDEGGEVSLTAAEEQQIRDMARQYGLKEDEVRQQFAEVRRKRLRGE